MAVSYKPLWKTLIDKNIKKKDLASLSGVSVPTISRMVQGHHVSTDTLERICVALGCELQDILEFVDTPDT